MFYNRIMLNTNDRVLMLNSIPGTRSVHFPEILQPVLFIGIMLLTGVMSLVAI